KYCHSSAPIIISLRERRTLKFSHRGPAPFDPSTEPVSPVRDALLTFETNTAVRGRLSSRIAKTFKLDCPLAADLLGIVVDGAAAGDIAVGAAASIEKADLDG